MENVFKDCERRVDKQKNRDTRQRNWTPDTNLEGPKNANYGIGSYALLDMSKNANPISQESKDKYGIDKIARKQGSKNSKIFGWDARGVTFGKNKDWKNKE